MAVVSSPEISLEVGDCFVVGAIRAANGEVEALRFAEFISEGTGQTRPFSCASGKPTSSL